eukprot:1154606-Pelagomonas_calceolata.AAC.2
MLLDAGTLLLPSSAAARPAHPPPPEAPAQVHKRCDCLHIINGASHPNEDDVQSHFVVPVWIPSAQGFESSYGVWARA